MLRQKLERDETVEASILNHPHPASTKLLDDAVMRDGLANHRGDTTPGEES